MGRKLIAAALVLVVIGTVWIAMEHRKMSSSVDKLGLRVSELEALNVHLAEQLESSNVETFDQWVKTAQTKRPARNEKVAAPSQSAKTTIVEKRIRALKADLLGEVTTIVEEEQQRAQQRQVEEQEQRWRDGLARSIKDFADDQGLDSRKAGKILPILEDTFKHNASLRQQLDAQNISFYEYRQERNLSQEVLDEELLDVLTEEEFKAFKEAFPRRF